jgi:predicted permease
MNGGFSRWWRRVMAFFRPDTLDRELQDELATHLELAAQDYAGRGVAPEEARRLAAMKLGTRDAARELHRDTRGLPTLDSVLKDLGYALRGFRREPTFTLIAIAILALGIGANTAVFSVVNPLLLRPLPFPEPDRLLWIAKTAAISSESGLSARAYRVDLFEELARNTRTLDEMSAYVPFFGFLPFTLTGHGNPEKLSGVPVGPRFFETFGVRPFAGRFFTRQELASKGPAAAILSYRLWQRRFASDPSIVGQALTINNRAVTVVGITPEDFDFASTFTPGVPVDFFVPAVFDDIRKFGNILAIVGRLKPGLTQDAARVDLLDLGARLKVLHPEWRNFDDLASEPIALKEHVAGGTRRSLVVLWAAVGLVLLIVCANLSNLLLARTAARSKEIAVRMALGAGRGRVLRQLLTEGLLLSVAGAALGIPLAYALTAYLQGRAGLGIPLLYHVRVDAATLVFTAAIAIVAGLAFGLIPALKVSGLDLHATLKEHNRGSTDGRGHAWLRSALVVVEVALACVLLVGAGLLLRSFVQLMRIDLGFESSRAFAIHIDTPTGLTSPQRNARLDEMLRHVRTTPGVEAAGLTDALPLDRNRTFGIGVPGLNYNGSDIVGAFAYLIGPGYLQAMGIPLVAGREFSEADRAGTPTVILINKSLARRLFGDRGREAVGQVVQAMGPLKDPIRVIGVVADVRQTNLDEAPAMQMYVARSQQPFAGAELIVRSTLAPDAIASTVRATLGASDPGLIATDFRPIDGLVERAVSPRRFLVTLLGGFSLLALTLACLGIYGVISYTVSQRVQEIGVRLALGATRADVSRQVIGSTLRLAFIGIAIGLLLSFLLARLIASLLFSTSPTDPMTFAATALTLGLVAALAGAVPAIRAARIDPMSALRAD